MIYVVLKTHKINFALVRIFKNKTRLKRDTLQIEVC